MILFLKNVLFTLIVPGSVAVYVPLLLARERSPADGVSIGASSLFFAAGAALYAWCVFDFATSGGGTPAPIDAPRRLVVRGPYRVVRNPMYVAVLTVIAGWVVLLRAPVLVAYGAAVAAGFVLFVRLYEEPHLARIFGRDFEAYTARVGRWLPRWRD